MLTFLLLPLLYRSGDFSHLSFSFCNGECEKDLIEKYSSVHAKKKFEWIYYLNHLNMLAAAQKVTGTCFNFCIWKNHRTYLQTSSAVFFFISHFRFSFHQRTNAHLSQFHRKTHQIRMKLAHTQTYTSRQRWENFKSRMRIYITSEAYDIFLLNSDFHGSV